MKTIMSLKLCALTLAACLLLILLVGTSYATGTILWETDTRAEFEKGKAKTLRIADPGVVSLSLETSSPKNMAQVLNDPLVWSVAAGSGEDVFLGTGNKGRVYRWSAKEGLALLADLDAAEIYAIALDKKGRLLVGASPGGIIYQVDKEGKTSIFCETKATYIWSMTRDAKGNLLVSTGKPAQVLKISSKGKIETLFKSPESHLISLLAMPDGRIFTGSVGKGLVYEITGKDKARVVWDSPAKEVRAMAPGPDGKIFIACTPEVKMAPRSPSSAAPAPKVNKASQVFLLSSDGDVKLWWQSPNALIFCLLEDGNGGVYAGTDNKGAIYHLPRADWSEAMLPAPGVMVLALTKDKKGNLLAGTGNPGKVIRVNGDAAKKGELVSECRDFGLLCKWGRLFWEASEVGNGTLTFSTRSGNTSEPDGTWSKWSQIMREPGTITSPPARFLQWKTSIERNGDKSSAKLLKVSASMQQVNRAPFIAKISAGKSMSSTRRPPSGRPPSGVKPGSPRPPSGAPSAKTPSKNGPQAVSVSWKAQDPNGDALKYALHYRGVGAKRWILIKKDLTAPSYPWKTDPALVPDGEYVIRVSADDSPSNPEAAVLRAKKISLPVVVDNTPPRVHPDAKLSVSGKRKNRTATLDIVDDTSLLHSAEYHLLDSEKWKPLLPVDGIFDQHRESLKIELKDLKEDVYWLAVRFRDRKGNITSTGIEFEVSK
jgi:hypothetical protein